MNNLAHKKNMPPARILPPTPSGGVQTVIRITQNLVALGEREMQALLQNDVLSFSLLQEEKENMTNHYKQASEEFQERLEEFRSVESALLDKLEAAQRRLGEITKGNNRMVEQMKNRAETNTQQTLLTVQELAQKRFVHSNQQTQQEGAR